MVHKVKISHILIFIVLNIITMIRLFMAAPADNLTDFFIPVHLRGIYFIACMVLTAVIGWGLYTYYKKKSHIQSVAFQWKYVGFIVLLYIADQVQMYLFHEFFSSIFFGTESIGFGQYFFMIIPQMSRTMYPGIWLILLKYANFTIMAPLFEEILFRGILPQVVLENYSNKVKLIVSSLLFATLHLGSYENIFQWLAFFNSGLILYAAYSMRKSLLDSIVLHSMMNSVQWILLFDLPRRLFF